MNLFLLRHGESEDNLANRFSSWRRDPVLSPAGILQAQAQATALASVGLRALYASPARRARQTVALLAESTGLPASFSDALIEVDVGELDGQPAEGENWDRYERVRRLWENGDERAGFEKGETLLQVKARLASFLSGLTEAGSPAVLVGHGMLFMCLLWLFCPHAGPTLQDHYMGRGHCTEIRGAGTSFRIERFNDPPRVE